MIIYVSYDLQKLRQLPKLPKKLNTCKRQKSASLDKSVPLVPVFCQDLLQRREGIQNQEVNKECLRMSLLLKACAQQTELSEIHLAGRNYGMNNELKLWKGPHSPLYTGNYGHRIIFFIITSGMF